MTIGSAAGLVGVSPQTLRVWEQQGLLSPKRTQGGTRLYDAGAVERAREIKRLRSEDGWSVRAIQQWAPVELDPDDWGELSMGARIQEARKARGLDRRALSRRSGIAERQLAAIERGETDASVRTLTRLADALAMPPSAFSPVRAPGTMLIRASERPRAELAGGVVCEELAAPGCFIEPFIVVIDAGGDTGGMVHRPGPCFVLGMEGTVQLRVGADEPAEVMLGPGDALSIAAGLPWSFRNDGDSGAKLLWVDEIAPGAWQQAFRAAGPVATS